MSLFFPLRMVRIRRTGQYINGRWADSGETELDIKASFQPVKGLELENLPEGERSDEVYKIYTKTDLLSSQQGTTTKGDKISYLGIFYDVIQVFPWQNGIQSHYKAIIRRVKE